MTLPTTTLNNPSDDDSDMFGPPRSSPIRHNNRPRVPMISAKLRLREERKRILLLCTHKLERIKDSETNLRRSVCINNTYSRLTDEDRREKLIRNNNNNLTQNNNNQQQQQHNHQSANLPITETAKYYNGSLNCSNNNNLTSTMLSHQQQQQQQQKPQRHHRSSESVDADLEILDRELNAIDAAMPLVDPEITQSVEQLERALVSRKRSRIIEEDNDRLVREALSQFYLPSPRLLSGIDDIPQLLTSSDLSPKRMKMSASASSQSSSSSITSSSNDLDLSDLNLDLNQNQKEFDVIMDALRLGTDSCGQAAMIGETGSVFHNLVVASLET